jgi:two-component system, NtrC family, response regulator HydG
MGEKLPAAGPDTVLVVDDQVDTRELLQRNLSAAGYRVFTAGGVAEAVRVLENMPVDLVVTDFKMPEIDGTELVRYVRQNRKETDVMMITGYATVRGAVAAMQFGAAEYLAKPFTSEELLTAVAGILRKLHARRDLAGRDAASRISVYGIIGNSPAMKKIFNFIGRASSTTATILINGESGTGKELVARAIHYNSNRASAPFVPVNCGGIPENLLESELFGYLKGAFTGASETRAGFFQTADGGTIFLDEVSEMTLAMQVKLLRVLQDKQVCMLGSRKAQPVNVRVVAATNKDLTSLVRKELFREDLFYRLNVLSVQLPPLRDRGDDLLMLIDHFLAKYATEMGGAPPRFAEETLAALRSYEWPGNVRELENVVQRLVVMAESESIAVSDLPAPMRLQPLSGSGYSRSLEAVEAEHIRHVLDGVKGNRSRAARILGVDRKTLREKLKRYNINVGS